MSKTIWFAAVLLVGCAAEETPVGEAAAALSSDELDEGRRLFNHETFGGNGRTCKTCHSPSNGTLTLEQIADRFAEDPAGPLFRGDGTDDGAGHGTSRIRADGTILITLPLPHGVTVLDDPAFLRAGGRALPIHPVRRIPPQRRPLSRVCLHQPRRCQ